MKEQYHKIIFGLKIKELRLNKGLSFSDLSKLSGMSISYLNEIEKGKKYPKIDKIKKLAKTLDTSVEEMTSFQLNASLLPVGELLRSNFLNELPLDLFGIELQKVVEMISKAPVKVGAFISTLVELSRNYALQEQNFYFGAMRAYQELHYNFFEEIEEQTDQFLLEHNLKPQDINSSILEKVLLEEYHCKVDASELSLYPELKNIHSIYNPKKSTLYIHKDVNEKQKTLLLGREIGFRFLELKDRPFYAPLRIPQSFDPVLNNFKATYFATAMILNRKELAKEVERFCSKETWDAEALIQIIKNYNVTPEMFVHRLTNILPKYFQLKALFFIRVRTEPDSHKYTIDKVLHLNQTHHPHSNKIYEHYCRRWISIDVLKDLEQARNQNNVEMITKIQRSKYHGTDDEYLTISIGIPAGPLQDKDMSVTFGILMDDWLKKVVQFSSDPAIPSKIVNKTCERCPIMDCKERVVPPNVYEQKKKWNATQTKLNEMIQS